MRTIWELDFYSRPLLDDQQKKVWEILICETPLEVTTDSDRLFRYSQLCASTQVNSVQLREALSTAISQAPNPPSKIRFFRRQMTNMIVKACKEVGIPAVPSRRTLTLYQWLQAREQDYYPQQPGYDPQAVTPPAVRYDTPLAQPLPDAILGEKWVFVTLEAQAFREMPEWEIAFAEGFPFTDLGLSETTAIPGIILYSQRAIPMAGWMSGLELGLIRLLENKKEINNRGQLLLETGTNDSWILSNLSTAQLLQEAQNFERAKTHSQGVHFLAIQANPRSESFAGFWLMRECPGL